jgi:hypothetical protein
MAAVCGVGHRHGCTHGPGPQLRIFAIRCVTELLLFLGEGGDGPLVAQLFVCWVCGWACLCVAALPCLHCNRQSSWAVSTWGDGARPLPPRPPPTGTATSTCSPCPPWYDVTPPWYRPGMACGSLAPSESCCGQGLRGACGVGWAAEGHGQHSGDGPARGHRPLQCVQGRQVGFGGTACAAHWVGSGSVVAVVTARKHPRLSLVVLVPCSCASRPVIIK